MASFQDLGLSPELLKAIDDMGFEEPSPIQVLAIPPLLAGSDVVGQAQTGTGKTAAFGLPLLEKITSSSKTQAIVLCPTRELAIQVAEELTKLAARKKGISVLPIYGGQAIDRQFRGLAKGAQVVVGTPGRIIDHLRRETLRLDCVAMAVLDEADEMLDMGFRDDIESVLEQTPENCQRVLFSATMPPAILELGKRFMHDPQILTITHKMLTVPAIEQTYYEVRQHQKMDALCRVLDSQGFRKALVFCSTKRSVDEVAMHLQGRGYQADSLHGNLAQAQRDRVMSRFRTGGVDILVATDVAARGLDVDDVDAVINYDIPHDVEGYVHRIGRTGRAGRSGSAFTFVTVREHYRLRDIIRYTKARITQGQLPTLRDVDHIRTSRLLEEVRQNVESGTLERWLVLVEEFLSEKFPDGEVTNRDMAAALLKLLMQRDFGNQDKTDFDDWADKSQSRAYDRQDTRRDFGRDKMDSRSGNRPGNRSEGRPSGDRFDSEGGNQGSRGRDTVPMTRIQLNVGHTHQIAPRDLVGAIAGETGIPGRSIGAIDIHDRFSVVDVDASLADDVMLVLNKGVFIGGIRVRAAKDTTTPRKTFPNTRQTPKFGKKPRGVTSGRKGEGDARPKRKAPPSYLGDQSEEGGATEA